MYLENVNYEQKCFGCIKMYNVDKKVENIYLKKY